MNKPQRIGILGGTFDPVHTAHCAMARAALEQAKLDRVLFVVSARPPHKSEGPYATAEERLAMVEAAVAGEPGLEACDIELEREGTSYTRDTLHQLKALYPGAALFLIVGYDMLLDLPRWKDPPSILSNAHLLVVHRPGLPDAVPLEVEGAYDMIAFEETTLSSTEVRERMAAGESCDGLVPPAVQEYMRRRGIYEVPLAVRQCPRAEEFIALITGRLKQKTRRHSLCTAQFMTTFVGQAGITREQAVTVGLVHDLGKGVKKSEMLETAKRYGIRPNQWQRRVPKLLHGPIAAEECRRDLGIEDEAVYEATYWHTTGRAGLGNLGVALYLADFAEPSRTFPEAAVARSVLAEEGFAEAVLYAAREKVERLRTKLDFVDPNSEAFLAWLETEWRAP